MSRPTTVYNVRVFDGQRVLPATAVRLAAGRITGLGDHTLAAPGDDLVDGGGSTLLPGLVDAHTHLQPGALEQALTFGVTTELDMFSRPELLAVLRERASTRGDLADLRSAGIGATAPGGHPSLLYAPMPTLTGPEQAADFVAARVAEGSDYLKVIYDAGARSPIPMPGISEATLRALVAAGHAHGLPVLVHANTLAGVRGAVLAGADGLQHVPVDGVLDPELAQLIAERGVHVTPTLATIEYALGRAGGEQLLADEHLAPYLRGEFWQRQLRLFRTPWAGQGPGPELAVRNTARLVEAGVTLLAGTDTPNPGTAHGVSLHRELELLVEAGLSAGQALTAATAGPAAAYRLADRGRIEPGRRADLLLVAGDPTAEITRTRRIDRIWRGGVEYDRAAFAGGAAEAELVEALRVSARRIAEGIREFVPAEVYQAMTEEGSTS